MKKIVIVLFLLFVTGCSLEYRVDIDKNVISEQTEIVENNSNWDKIAYKDIYYGKDLTYKEAIDRFSKNPIATDINHLDLIYTDVSVDYEVYNVKVKEHKNSLGLTYQYDFSYDEFASSTMANTCYNRFAFLNQDGTYYLSTSDMVTCFESFPLLEDITVHISSYYEVVSHNADKQNLDRNEYTWVIHKDQSANKPIKMVIDTNKKANIKRNLMDYFKENPLLIGLLFIVAISGLITIPIMIIKNKKNNEI